MNMRHEHSNSWWWYGGAQLQSRFWDEVRCRCRYKYIILKLVNKCLLNCYFWWAEKRLEDCRSRWCAPQRVYLALNFKKNVLRFFFVQPTILIASFIHFYSIQERIMNTISSFQLTLHIPSCCVPSLDSHSGVDGDGRGCSGWEWVHTAFNSSPKYYLQFIRAVRAQLSKRTMRCVPLWKCSRFRCPIRTQEFIILSDWVEGI